MSVSSKKVPKTTKKPVKTTKKSVKVKKISDKNYKPRIEKFKNAGGTDIKVDTRMGRNGYYPGDLCDLDSSSPMMLLGIDEDNMCVWAYDEGIQRDYSGLYKYPTDCVGKRYGQKLIDAGEMKQKK